MDKTLNLKSGIWETLIGSFDFKFINYSSNSFIENPYNYYK